MGRRATIVSLAMLGALTAFGRFFTLTIPGLVPVNPPGLAQDGDVINYQICMPIGIQKILSFFCVCKKKKKIRGVGRTNNM